MPGISPPPTASSCCLIHSRCLARRNWRGPEPSCLRWRSRTRRPAAVLENITSLFLSAEGKRPDQRISKPLAIVFTKMDAFLHDLKETSPLRRLPAHGAHFDERDSLYVHGEIQRLLTRWDGARIDRIASQNYSSYRYFGVSALGEAPTPARNPRRRPGISPRHSAVPSHRPVPVAPRTLRNHPGEVRREWHFSSFITPPVSMAWAGTPGTNSTRLPLVCRRPSCARWKSARSTNHRAGG